MKPLRTRLEEARGRPGIGWKPLNASMCFRGCWLA